MAKADVWMPLFIGDYLADTGRLSTEQHGAYLLLIMDYWRNGPPPDDADTLAQITHLSLDAWSIAQAKLKHFFSIEDGVWRHKRIDEELVAARENKGKAQAKAKAAADARWGKGNSDASSNAPSTPQAMHEECPSPSPSPLPSSTSKPTTTPKSKAGATASGSRLPEDWKPSLADVEYCKTERPDLQPSKVAQNFYDYWIAIPGAKGRKLDWSATWRTWVRKETAASAGRQPGVVAQFAPKLTQVEINAKNNAEAKRLLGIGTPCTEGEIIDAR
jgi:uncharacterized protein YdaU (DUF1376 family)